MTRQKYKVHMGKVVVEFLKTEKEPCTTREILDNILGQPYLRNITTTKLGNHLNLWCVNVTPNKDLAHWVLKEEYQELYGVE